MQRLLLKGVFWRGIYFVSLFVLSVLMSRYYQAPGSGQIFYDITLLAWITLILSFCLEFGMNYFLASQQISASKLAGLAVVWSLAAGSIGYFLLNLISKRYMANSWNITLFRLSTIYIVGNLFITFFSALFYAVKNFVVPNVVLIVVNVFLIWLIPKNTLLHLDQDHFLTIYLYSFLVQGIFLLILFLFSYVKSLNIKIPTILEMKMLLSMSTWALFTNALSMVLYRADYWFVHHYCSPLELGNYIQASKMGQVFLMVPAVVSTTIFPMTASKMLNAPVKDIQQVSRNLVFFSLPPAILLMLMGKWLFPLVFGESFELMHIPFALLTPGIIAFCVICPITSYFGGIKMLHANFLSLLASVVLVLLLNLLFVPKFGIQAAAIISSVGYIFYAACLLWFFNKKHKISSGDFLLIRGSDLYWVREMFS